MAQPIPTGWDAEKPDNRQKSMILNMYKDRSWHIDGTEGTVDWLIAVTQGIDNFTVTDITNTKAVLQQFNQWSTSEPNRVKVLNELLGDPQDAELAQLRRENALLRTAFAAAEREVATVRELVAAIQTVLEGMGK